MIIMYHRIIGRIQYLLSVVILWVSNILNRIGRSLKEKSEFHSIMDIYSNFDMKFRKVLRVSVLVGVIILAILIGLAIPVVIYIINSHINIR